MSPQSENEPYDERNVLVDYIYDSDLLTQSEQLATEVLIVRMQADGLLHDDQPAAAEKLLFEKGRLDHEEVNRLLEGGSKAFEDRVVDRIIQAEELGELKINRCPKCQKVVRTKLARQCLWCGYDWH